MYVFYSEQVQASKIFASKLLKQFPSMRAINIDDNKQAVSRYGLKKIPSVMRGDRTILQGEECKKLFQSTNKRLLGYNREDGAGASINNHPQISTPADQMDVSRDYNYCILSDKGLLGQTLKSGRDGITDNSYQTMLVESSRKNQDSRENLDKEISQTLQQQGNQTLAPIKVKRDTTMRF